MAFFGVLPEIPSFGSQFARSIGSGLSKGIESSAEMASKLMGERLKQKQFSDFFSSLGGSASGGDSEGASPDSGENAWRNLSFQQKAQIANAYPDVAKMMQSEEEHSLKSKKLSQEVRATEQEEGSFREGIGDLEKIFEGDHFFDQKYFGVGSKANEQKQYVDQLGIAMADRAYTKNNKGPLTEAKIEQFIKPMAPNSSLPASVNKARIKALKKMYGLSEGIPEHKFNKIWENETKKIRQIEKREGVTQGPLTNDVIDKFLDQYGNDWKKAEKAARDAGYEF